MDEDEVIKTKLITLKKALDMVRKNQIKDVKSIACILLYARMVGA